jgi:hypothetical protein
LANPLPPLPKSQSATGRQTAVTWPSSTKTIFTWLKLLPSNWGKSDEIFSAYVKRNVHTGRLLPTTPHTGVVRPVATEVLPTTTEYLRLHRIWVNYGHSFKHSRTVLLAQFLQDQSNWSICKVAVFVGYKSVVAFSRSFERTIG